MLTTKSRWLLAAGVVAVAAAALALGVAPGRLLLLGAALLCPAVMLFGMHGAGGGHGAGCCAGHPAGHGHAETRGGAGAGQEGERRKAE